MRCPLAFFIKPARLYTPFSDPVFAMIFLASGSAEIEPRPEIVPSTPAIGKVSNNFKLVSVKIKNDLRRK